MCYTFPFFYSLLLVSNYPHFTIVLFSKGLLLMIASEPRVSDSSFIWEYLALFLKYFFPGHRVLYHNSFFPILCSMIMLKDEKPLMFVCPQIMCCFPLVSFCLLLCVYFSAVSLGYILTWILMCLSWIGYLVIIEIVGYVFHAIREFSIISLQIFFKVFMTFIYLCVCTYMCSMCGWNVISLLPDFKAGLSPPSQAAEVKKSPCTVASQPLSSRSWCSGMVLTVISVCRLWELNQEGE